MKNKSLSSTSVKTISGSLRPPGDKSISHRALMFGLLSVGRTTVEGLLMGEDVLSTLEVCRALGAEITQEDDLWHIDGMGVGALQQPQDVLNFGNAGTSVRLLMGVLATHPLQCFLTGDNSLRSRPMGRVVTPLSQFGTKFHATDNRLPMMMVGAKQPIPIEYTLPMASAQVKSAVLLAGLNCPGKTTVIEPTPTRDHTERMLKLFGADLSTQKIEGTGNIITLSGYPELKATEISVPADISSAAFAMVAAAIVEGSEVTIKGVMDNPTRNGILLTLQEMGAEIETTSAGSMSGEDTLNIHLRGRPLKGITVPVDRVPSMVDEFPVLAVAAACAKGESLFEGIGELRVKESDRLEETAKMLRQAGVTVETGKDWMRIQGMRQIPGGGHLEIHGDHRLAMSTLILGAITHKPMSISDYSTILTSYPNFVDQMNSLGLNISVKDSSS